MPKEYIEREPLIDWLTKPTGFKTFCEDCTDIDCLDCIVDVIKNRLPEDVVEVVHGKWLQNEPETIYCSECNYSVWSYYNTPYCPNCGAKMDGKEE